MSATFTRDLDEAGVVRLAELLALKLARGMVVALTGEVGAGKTTLARALIRALTAEPAGEVPSPTFSLSQVYETPRLTLTHFDFYRLGSALEAREIGFDDALAAGAVVVEWPQRAPGLLPADRIDIGLCEVDDPALRRVRMQGLGAAAAIVRRIADTFAFLEREPRWAAARVAHLQGDAGARSYARLTGGEASILLMDAPPQADGPLTPAAQAYSRIARLAEDMRPFVAIAAALRGAGLSAPEVAAADLGQGLLLVEDLGDRVFGAELAAGASQAELWRAATDVLIALRGVPLPARLPLPDGSTYTLPRRDRAAFEVELALLLDWHWPAVKGTPAPPAVREEFMALWSPVLDRLLALPGGWFLRDFHSPNLLWLPRRAGLARVGLIDFQDALDEHAAFDLVSLLQDGRIPVPEALERDLFAYYLAEVARREPAFDPAAFAAAYADFGAQRNTRLLGLWLRLAVRDGKPSYLRLIPQTWGYLLRNLAAPALAPVAAWYDAHFPPELRTGTPPGRR